MKIALLASCFLPHIGGAEVVIHNLAIHLRRMGHNPHVITWWGNWRRIRGQLPYPVHPLLPRSYTESDRTRLEKHGLIRKGMGRQIRFYQWLYSFDILHVHLAHPMMGPLSVRTGSESPPPFVMTCHGGDLLYDETARYGARRNPVLDRLVRDSILACDQVTSHSFLMDAEYLGMGVPKGRITRIPNGADVSRIAGVPVDRRMLREQHGIPADAPLCITVGRHVAVKGYHYIPAIMELLASSGLDMWWVLIGADTEKIREMTKSAEIRTRLITLSAIGMNDHARVSEKVSHFPPEEIIRWYKTADMYVHPAIMEAFGNIIIEAMAAGLPVVATDRTGASECVEKAQCGLIARSGDVADMADKIMQLAADDARRADMAQKARRGAEAYDWPLIAQRYSEVYEKAVGFGKR